MMPSAINTFEKSGKIPLLIATASAIQILESMLPHPIPGLRFGLANIISLIILIRYGLRPALTVTLLRCVVSSFILGTFLSPGFILSLAAGFASISVSGLLHLFSNRVPLVRISPVGLSIAGAFTHNMVQLCLAYLLLIKHAGLFFLVPWLSFGSVLLGTFSGVIASGILKQLTLGKDPVSISSQPKPAYKNRVYHPGNSWIHECRPDIKFGFIIITTLILVFIENLILYAILFSGILVLIPAAGVSYKNTFRVIRKISVIIFSSFILPLYFNSGSIVLLETDFVSIHKEAVITGILFASRIIILALLSSILAQTTRTDEFTQGIRVFIRPFDRIGLDSSSIADNISLSLSALPDVWDEMRSVITFLLEGRPRNFKTLKMIVTEIFVYIFSMKNSRP